MVFSKVAIGFLVKMFAYKKGSSALFSLSMSILLTFSIDNYINIFMKDTDPKATLVPVFIQIVMLAIFLIFNFFDFLLGVRVSKKKNGDDFNWDKVFDTTAKIVGICLITFMVMFLAIMAEVVNSDWAWWIAMVSQSFLWILANGFEFGSIGRHIENLKGSKPRMFMFFDNVLEALQRKAIDKIDSSFNILDEVDREENRKNNQQKSE